MSRIYWDTNLFIYLFEDYGQLSERVATLRRRMRARNDQLFASTLTLGEVLVKPIEKGNQLLRQQYEHALENTAVLIPFGKEAAGIYASLRCDRTLKAPDAIQLACAAVARVDMFITNDDRLAGKVVPEIQFIVPLAKAFL